MSKHLSLQEIEQVKEAVLCAAANNSGFDIQAHARQLCEAMMIINSYGDNLTEGRTGREVRIFDCPKTSELMQNAPARALPQKQ